MISNCLCQWDIHSKLLCVLRDSGSNFVSGLRDSNIPNLGCLAHNIQLVINDGVLAEKSVQDLLQLGRRIVGHYRRSNVAFHVLQRVQTQLDLKVCCLIQDEPTRWNSSYYMLKRLIEQRKAISGTNAELNETLNFSTTQCQLAEKVVRLLQPFEEATEDISCNTSSISLVIPIINSLKRILIVEDDDTGIMSMKRKMSLSIADRFTDIERHEFYSLSTLLDPRFKDKVFSSHAAVIHSREQLLAKCEEIISSSKEVQEVTSQAKKHRKEQEEGSMLWAQVDEIMKSCLTTSSTALQGETSEISTMVDAYLAEPLLSRHANALDYWSKKKALWPFLSILARKFLTPPCTSVPSERLFSSAGNVVTDKRNRLAAEKVEMLLFLNRNLEMD